MEKKFISLLLTVLIVLSLSANFFVVSAYDEEKTLFSAVKNESVVNNDELLASDAANAAEAFRSASANEEEFRIVLDLNDSKVNSYQSTNGNYYLFLPNNVVISDLSFTCSVPVRSVSNGDYNPATGIISNAFTKANDSVVVTDVTNKDYTVIVMQAPKIASIMIDLNGTDLHTINTHSKDDKYPDNTVSLISKKGKIDRYEKSVEIKGRGNTTWLGTKKPYQIKFSKKTSVFGMDKAKKWVLLANAYDDSLMRNEVAFAAISQLGLAYTPDYEYANLWIDGEYLGFYLICEKAEIGSGRLELEDDTGCLFELDDAYYYEEAYYFDTELGHFTVKEHVSEEEPDIYSSINGFKSKLSGLLNYLAVTDTADVTLEGLGEYIDVPSFAACYFIIEMLKCKDMGLSSCYFFIENENDIIHYGPAWDFDASLGDLYDAEFQSYEGNAISCSKLISVLNEYPAFHDYCVSYYEQYKPVFEGMAQTVSNSFNTNKAAADMNYTRYPNAFGAWQLETGYLVKIDVARFHNSYIEAIDYLLDWVTNRVRVFSIKKNRLDLKHNGDLIKITFTADRTYNNVRFDTCSYKDGYTNIISLNATRNSDGTYSASLDTNLMHEGGVAAITVYGNNERIYDSDMYLYSGSENCEVTVEGVDGSELEFEITAQHCTAMNSVSAAVWSLQGGQDDLVWYTLQQTAPGTYKAIVPINAHKTTGAYAVHVYVDGVCKTLSSFNVSGVTGTNVVITDRKDGSIAVRISGMETPTGIKEVLVPAWTVANSQDDLVWHTAELQQDGSYLAIIDCSEHNNELGTYCIHVYAETGNSITQCVYTGGGEMTMLPASVTAEDIDGTQCFYRIRITSCKPLSEPKVAVWSRLYNQDDLVWYPCELNEDGAYYALVDISNHKTAGVFDVHAYDGRTQLAKTTFTVDVVPSGIAQIRDNGNGTATINVGQINYVSGVSSLVVAVWPHSDFSKLEWYPVRLLDNGTYTCTIDVADHGYTFGYYAFDVYVLTNNGISSKYSSNNLFISVPNTVVSTEAVSGGYRLSIANINQRAKKVYFAVWGDTNGQNDLVWLNTQYDMVTKTATVDWLENENSETGIHFVHVYIINDSDQLVFVGSSLFDRPDPNQPICNVSVNRLAGTFTITVENIDSYTFENVLAPTWSDVNGQDDLIWYNVRKSVDGTYKVMGSFAAHKYSRGSYTSDIYLRAADGTHLKIQRLVFSY